MLSQSIFLSTMRSCTDTFAVILLPFMFFRVTTGECPKMNDIPVMMDTYTGARFTCMRHWYETGSDLYPEINACNGIYEGPCTEPLRKNTVPSCHDVLCGGGGVDPRPCWHWRLEWLGLRWDVALFHGFHNGLAWLHCLLVLWPSLPRRKVYIH